MVTGANAWIEDELAGCHFADERLGRRLSTLLDQMAGGMGNSIPLACQDWANTKAAYRFFANNRVSEADILAGHFDSTRQRVAATTGPLLVIQDTTEFSFHREHPEKIGTHPVSAAVRQLSSSRGLPSSSRAGVRAGGSGGCR